MNLMLYIMYILLSSCIILIYNGKIHSHRNGMTISVTTRYIEEAMLIYVLFGVFSLLCATRLYNSYDTFAYADYLERMCEIPFFKWDRTYRIGFEFFTKTYAIIAGNNYVVFFALIAVINCIVVFRAVQNSKYADLNSLFIYFGFLGLYYSYIILRQSMALSFVILAYSYMDKSRIKPYMYVLIAMLFHESALIVFVVMLLASKCKVFNKRAAYIITVLSVLLYISKFADRLTYHLLNFIYPLLPWHQFHTYIIYLDPSTAIYDISLFYLMCYGILFFLIYKNDGEDAIYNCYLTINMIGYLILSLFSTYAIIGRLSDYLTSATVLFLLPSIWKNPTNKKIVTIVLFLLVTFFYTRIILGPTTFY